MFSCAGLVLSLPRAAACGIIHGISEGVKMEVETNEYRENRLAAMAELEIYSKTKRTITRRRSSRSAVQLPAWAAPSVTH